MTPVVLSLLAFGAVVMSVLGTYSILSDVYLRDRSRVSERIDDEFRKRQRQRVKKSLLNKDIAQLSAEVANEEEKIDLRQYFETLIEQSGLDLSIERLQLILISSGVVTGILAGLVRQSVWTGLVWAVVGAGSPLLFIQYKRRSRIEKLRSQLPDAYDLMGRVIRSGQTTQQAMLAVADEFPQPIAAEFAYCYEQQNLGLSTENSLRDLGRRTGLLEIKIFVVAVLVQQQTGGNLAELLDKLSTVVRDRFKLRGQVKALTAEGRLQAAVLLALPPAMFLILLLLNRSYASILFQHPSLIITTLVSELIGALWIRKIVNFEY